MATTARKTDNATNIPQPGTGRNLEPTAPPSSCTTTISKADPDAAIGPIFNAAVAIAAYPNRTGELDPLVVMNSLRVQIDETVKGGKLDRQEATLVAQTHTLDVLFSYLVRLASSSKILPQFEAYMRMALRAQNQSRMTIETLNLMKNPPSAMFVRQANVANGPQQINNGTRAGEIEKQPNELLALEQRNGERLEFGAAQTPGRVDSNVATLAAVKRTANGER